MAFLLGAAWWFANGLGLWPAHLGLWIACQKITLLFWPSSLWMIATERAQLSSALLLLLLSALANAAAYAAIGASVWYGLFRRRVALAVPIFLIAALWSCLLRLY